MCRCYTFSEKGAIKTVPGRVTRYERFVNAVAIQKKIFAASIHIGSPGSAVQEIKIAPFSENVPHLNLLKSCS